MTAFAGCRETVAATWRSRRCRWRTSRVYGEVERKVVERGTFPLSYFGNRSIWKPIFVFLFLRQRTVSVEEWNKMWNKAPHCGRIFQKCEYYPKNWGQSWKMWWLWSRHANSGGSNTAEFILYVRKIFRFYWILRWECHLRFFSWIAVLRL